MTAQLPHECSEYSSLLPAYVNGQLDADLLRLMREHLRSCNSCQAGLAEWQALKDAALLVYETTPLPSAAVLDQALNRISLEVQQPATNRLLANWQSFARWPWRLWQIFWAQIPLLHRSLWFASPLISLVALSLIALAHPETLAQKQLVGNLLVLFISVTGASSCAFLYGSAHDAGFELMVTTPTSVRFLMLSRMVLVLGYNLVWGILASAAFAVIYGGGFWGMMQLWLGPLLFLSSLTLMLSLFLGSTFALICAAILGILQNFPHTLNGYFSLHISQMSIDPTSPLLWLGALLLLVCALSFAPRQPRLAS